MKQFDEAVLTLAIKLGYLNQADEVGLRNQFEKYLDIDIKVTFEKFLLYRNIIDRQQAKRLRASATSLIAPKIPGFNIIELLGSGGMGEVYKAKQITLDRIVALKVLSKPYHQNSEFLARFKREARVAGKIDNSNIVKAYDFFLGNIKKNVPPYLVMEFVEGKTLHEIIQNKKKLGEKQVIKIGISLANAIDSIARSGLVHRDIKPDNIIITMSGDIKLCDLGLAKEAIDTQNLTEVGITHGTPHYMSPEQAQSSDNLDYRTDLYSLGCTLFKLLTGQPPYLESNAIEILMKHISAPIPRITEFRQDVSENLSEIIYLLLQKNPDKRYQSPKKLKNDLTSVSLGEKPKFDVSADEQANKDEIAKKLDVLNILLDNVTVSDKPRERNFRKKSKLDLSKAAAIDIQEVQKGLKVRNFRQKLVYYFFAAAIVFNLFILLFFRASDTKTGTEEEITLVVTENLNNEDVSETISLELVRNAILNIVSEDNKSYEQSRKDNAEKIKSFEESQKN